MRCKNCANLFESMFDGKLMCAQFDCVKGSHYISKDKPKKIEPIRLDKNVRENENFWRNK